jgi:PPP family 3-phenylpropionic acid transporter
MPARSFAIRVSLLFLFLFFGMGIQLPFLPLWLKDRGLAETDIATILAAQIAIRIVSAPAGAFLADRHGTRRAMIQGGALAAFAAYVLLCFLDGFWLLLMGVVVAGACFSMIVPLAEALAVEGASLHGLDFGRLRLWGTLSFMAGNVVAGLLLEVVPVSNVIVMIALAQGTLLVATVWLPPDPSAAPGGQAATTLRVSDALRLFAHPAFPLFLAAVSFGQASHAVYYSFGSVHWQALGYSEIVIGLLWLTGGVAEVLVFGLAGKPVRILGPVMIILIGTAGGVLRWFVTATDPMLALLFAVQALHAFSFTLTHFGTVLYIQQFVSQPLRNTAQGLYAALSGGLAMSIATVISGPLYRDYGGGAYLVMAAVSCAAVGFVLGLLRFSPRERAMGGTS